VDNKKRVAGLNDGCYSFKKNFISEVGYILGTHIKVNLSLCFNWAPRHEGV